jgi:hypothetical protein
MKRLGVALLLLAVLPAEAAADIRFRGQSGQDKLVTLRTGDNGLVERFGINWQARCRDPRFIYRTGTQTTPRSPFEVHSRDRFVDVGGYRERIGDGLRAVYHARTVGNRISERRWRGIFRIRTKVLRGSRLIDRCYVRTRWRVLRRG